MIIKLLGGIDLAGAFGLLMLIFGIDVFTVYLLGCAFLLFLKGLFVFTGDVLSVVDLYASLVLVISVFILPFMIILWIGAFLLLAKGFVSFL